MPTVNEAERWNDNIIVIKTRYSSKNIMHQHIHRADISSKSLRMHLAEHLVNKMESGYHDSKGSLKKFFAARQNCHSGAGR